MYHSNPNYFTLTFFSLARTILLIGLLTIPIKQKQLILQQFEIQPFLHYCSSQHQWIFFRQFLRLMRNFPMDSFAWPPTPPSLCKEYMQAYIFSAYFSVRE